MRINKYLTDHGFCSRREADRLIEAGKVFINGRRAILGAQVEEKAVVTVSGQKVAGVSRKVYIMYNKPIGITCTTDKSIRTNIVDAVNHPMRVFPIGRLDKESNGLIFLTNDGDIVNKILRAQYGHEKEYIIRVRKLVTEDFLKKMSNGVDIGGYVTKPCKVTKMSDRIFSIILTEGKNRQIRRMCEALGNEVKALQRIRIMNVKLLPHLEPGMWKDIPKPVLKSLKQMIEKKTDDSKDTDWDNSEE